MIKVLGLTVLLATLSGVAAAGESCKGDHFLGFSFQCSSGRGNGDGEGRDHRWGDGGCDRRGDGGGIVTAAPEIDPASALAGLTLALGGLAVLRGRRSTIPYSR